LLGSNTKVSGKENMDMVKELFPIGNDSLSEREKESVYRVLARHTAIVSGNKTWERREMSNILLTLTNIRQLCSTA
jgi:hypothetical protein